VLTSVEAGHPAPYTVQDLKRERRSAMSPQNKLPLTFGQALKPTSADIERELRNLTEERLLSGKQLPADDWAVAQKFIDWKLVEEDEIGWQLTALGAEVSANFWAVIMGHHYLPEIPHLLAEFDLLSVDEADYIVFDRVERDGEDIEDILLPILRQIYLTLPR